MTEEAGPFLVIPLRRGAIPDLTPAQARQILQPEERYVSVSSFDASLFVAPCAQSGHCLSAFTALNDFHVILVTRSSFQGLHPTAPSTDNAIVGAHENGRIVVTVDKWREMIQVLRPAIAVTPYESVALSEPLSKRRKTAQARSESWSHLACRHAPSVDCTVLRPLSLRDSACGFVDMVPRNETPDTYYTALVTAAQAKSTTTMCVAYSVVAIAAALLAGVRLVESPLPWALAEKGIALTVDISGTTHSAASSAHDVQLDLNDDCYKLDVAPLCADCSCYTCRRHHRAYIHHLLTVQEMNSAILLAIHNLSRTTELVRRYRATEHAKRASYIAAILSQY